MKDGDAPTCCDRATRHVEWFVGAKDNGSCNQGFASRLDVDLMLIEPFNYCPYCAAAYDLEERHNAIGRADVSACLWLIGKVNNRWDQEESKWRKIWIDFNNHGSFDSVWPIDITAFCRLHGYVPDEVRS